MSLSLLNGDWPVGFTYPWVLLLWLLYPLCLRFCRRQETVRNFGNLAMLKNSAGRRIDPVPWLGGLALLLILTSLAGPYGIRSVQKSVIQGREIALLLDASNSMSDEKRFDEARKILADFIRSRKSDRLALEVFGDRAALASAATADHEALLRLLDALRPGVVGGRETALYEALFRTPELFEKEYRGPKVAILLTDGIDTAGSVPLQAALLRLHRHGVRVYAIGIGEDYRAKTLRRVAEETGGRFFAATRPKDLKEIYHRIDTLERSPLQSRRQLVHLPLQRYTLFGAAFALLLLLWFERNAPKGRWILLLSFLSIGASLATAPTPRGDETPPSKAALMILLDLSRSMHSHDLPPDRLHWSIERLKRLLQKLPSAPIGLLGFSGESYLIAPPSANRETLEWTLDHLPLDQRLAPGSDPLEAIRSGIKMLGPWSRRNLLLISDGGNAPLLRSALPLLHESNTTLFAYPAATPRGAPVPAEGGGYLQDASGAVVISRLNPSIIELARQSGGFAPSDPTDVGAFERLVSSLGQALKSATHSERNASEPAENFLAPWRVLGLAAAFLLLAALFRFPVKEMR